MATTGTSYDIMKYETSEDGCLNDKVAGVIIYLYKYTKQDGQVVMHKKLHIHQRFV